MPFPCQNTTLTPEKAALVQYGAMLEGKCPKCGCCYVGWALRFPRNQSCSICGAALEITENGKNIFKGYSPFTAEKYSVKTPPNVSASEDKEKGKISLDDKGR